MIGREDRFSGNKWKEFEVHIENFGILRWEIDEPSSSVDFFDLTIEIKDGMIIFKTYQMPVNLYQYINSNSENSP